MPFSVCSSYWYRNYYQDINHILIIFSDFVWTDGGQQLVYYYGKFSWFINM